MDWMDGNEGPRKDGIDLVLNGMLNETWMDNGWKPWKKGMEVGMEWNGMEWNE